MVPTISARAWDAVGLSPVEAQVYFAMLKVPSTDVAALATQVTLTHEQVLDTLRGLEDRGLVSRAAGHDARFIAAAPDLAFGPVVAERETQLEAARAALSELSTAHRAARAQNASELVEVVSGEAAIRERLRQMLHRARHEVLALTKPPYAEPVNDPELDLLARGIKVRSLYGREALERADDVATIQGHIAAGERARVTGQVPVKLVVVDAGLAMLPLAGGDGRDAVAGALLVYPSGLLDSLVALFETLWALGTPFGEAGQGSPHDDDGPMDREILAMLFAGLTDQAIARQLGTSPRTVQRLVRRLMERYSAVSRFQLGAIARERGLLD